MNIVYASDNNYALIAGVSIFSLLDSNKDSAITIYYLFSDLSENNKEKLRSIVDCFDNATIVFIDVEDNLNKLAVEHLDLHGSYLTYARLFISVLIPNEVDKVLYLDCDTLICGNLYELYNSFMPKLIGMCIDIVSKKYKVKLGLHFDSYYYNAGVSLIDLKQYRQMDLHKKVMDALKDHVEILYHDQDILNYALSDYIFPISPSFNFISQYFYFYSYRNLLNGNGISSKDFYSDGIYRCAFSNIVIYHFTTNPVIVRPWFKNSNHPRKKEFYEIRKHTPFQYEKMVNCQQRWKQVVLRFIFNIFPMRLASAVITLLHKLFF